MHKVATVVFLEGKRHGKNTKNGELNTVQTVLWRQLKSSDKGYI